MKEVDCPRHSMEEEKSAVGTGDASTVCTTVSEQPPGVLTTRVTDAVPEEVKLIVGDAVVLPDNAPSVVDQE